MYDVIVIGNDISSLIAACRAVDLGFKAVLVSDNPPQPQFTLQGFSFDLDPLPYHTIPDMDDFAFLKCLSSNDSDDSKPVLQVILPAHRVDFSFGKHDQIKEFIREFPDHSIQIHRLYNLIDDSSRIIESLITPLAHSKPVTVLLSPLLKTLRYSLLWSIQMKRLQDIPALRNILETHNGLFSGCSCPASLPLTSACHLSGSMKRNPYLQTPKGTVFDALRDYLRNHGGSLYEAYPVLKVQTGKDIEVSIIQQDGEVCLAGKNLILSTAWGELDHLINDDRIAKWRRHHADALGQSYYPYTLHIGVCEKAIPEKMARYVIVNSGNDDFSADANPFVFLEISNPGDLSRAPQDARALSATIFLKTSPRALGPDRLIKISDIIFKRLNNFLPFLKENLLALDVEASSDLSIKYQDLIMPKFGRCPGFIGSAIFSSKKPKKNVIMTGNVPFPALGFTGEVFSGIYAANQIRKGGR